MATSASSLIYTKTATSARTVLEAHARSRELFRKSVRLIPWISDTFQLDYSKREMTNRIRERFDQSKDVTQLEIINRLLHKGENEIQETLMLWKTRSHVVQFFETNTTDTRSFLQRFLDNDPYENEEEKEAAFFANCEALAKQPQRPVGYYKEAIKRNQTKFHRAIGQ
eukprot:TRINITY_DN1755_c0_g1_i1.p1 TRINITY_DN1755_c0_g1~~TRINITY_DN1755_c0_g1_i1.p1  ORF type:complete len:168 (+),score=39.65 TRINITY_DN1755_c0_g1_i1:112-615(+)